MSLRVGTSGIQPEDLKPERRLDVPCQFLGAVGRVWEVEEGGATNLLLEVVESSDVEQVGCVHIETLHHSGATPEKDRHVRRRLLRYAQALGLVTDEEIEAGQPVGLDFDAAIGREAVFAVIRSRYKDDDGKTVSSIQGGFLDVWHVNDGDGPDRSKWYTAQSEEVAE